MKKTLLVFYDGYCPLCNGSKKAIEKADWFDRIEFLSFREPGIAEKYRLTGKNPEERIQGTRLRDGRSYEGIHTILQIAIRVPMYWIFVPFLYFAIKTGWGQAAYDFIARRRKIVPVGQCDDGSCPVHFEEDGKE